VGAALVSLRESIREMQDRPPTAAEIEAARAMHRATWPMEFSTLSRLLGTYADADAAGLAAEVWSGHAKELDALNPAAVAATTERWMEPDRLQILAVGPAERLRPQLEAFGEVEVVQLEGVPETPWASTEVTDEDRARGAEIVARAAKVHGGSDKIRRIKDSSLTADVIFMSQGREVPGRLRQLRKDPLQFREETDAFVFRNESVLNGDFGWTYDSRQERVIPADSLQLATLRSMYLSDVPHLLQQAIDKDANPVFRGVETIGDRRVNVLELRGMGDEKQLWLLFDADSGHLVASDVRGGVPPQVLARQMFSDLRPVGGVLLPFSEERYVQNTLVMKLHVLELAVNVGIDDTAFGMPRIRN
jgi:hypothetical protein